MRRLKRSFSRLLGDCKGATAVEYGFIVALIVIAIIASIQELASTTTGIWTNVSDKVQNPGG